MTLATFNSHGKTPCCRDKLHKYDRGFTIDGETSFSNAALISSCPAAPFFKEESILLTSSEVTWDRNIELTDGLPIRSSGDIVWWGIFFAKLGPIFTKKSLNFDLITKSSVVNEPSVSLNLVGSCFVLFLFTIFFHYLTCLFHAIFISFQEVRVMFLFSLL